jgi:hypothetical protein
MNADELTEIRKIPLQAMNKTLVIAKLLTHIDSQAKELSRTYQMIYGMAKAGNEYPKIIERHDKQIAALKAALVARDLRLLEECNGECGKNDIKPDDCGQCEHEYVISQLARELPEIDWEGMK